ncbi:YVTN family beta-propeller repeat protein [Paraburkholderia sp. RL17-373-BIF-A]|uniref:YVTN family beta-propeller repeat protein n=1 Tax=Paraburkholderia sp. RL17-373-BIF-A TaxID=3031629 RepID=UPI0038BCA99E
MRFPFGALLLMFAFQLPAHAENVIVLNSADASVSLIDEATQKEVDTFPVGKEPHHLMATPDNQSLIVANSVANNLVFLDPKSGKVQRWVPDIEDPYQLGFSYDRKWFVTNRLRLDRVDIYHYDGKNVTLAKRVPLSAMPSHMIFSADNKIVFVTLQVSGEVDKGAHNFRSLVDGQHILVSNRVGNTISILDQNSLTNVGTITGLLPGPDDMELTPDKRYLWVTFRFTRYVGIIDMKTLKLVNTIKVGKSPHGIYFYNRAPLV